ncbi:MAG: hypothetical protein NW215_04000 [Hyphomicrobiales bacterium]|nr:hypothetical protein [Hyphomicrobiales bacterium]
MLLSLSENDRGEERVVVLPLGSVVSYFAPSSPRRGVVLHVEPGATAYACEFARNEALVRDAVLAEAARRLRVSPEDVLQQTFAALKAVADAPLKEGNPWISARRSRGAVKGFRR